MTDEQRARDSRSTKSADPIADPIADAIARASEGLSEAEHRKFNELVRLGLRRMSSSAPPADLAEDVSAAGELSKDRRLSWAEAFALEPLVRQLNRRALAMVTALAGDATPREELHREAEEILAKLDDIDLGAIDDEDRRRLQRLVGEARIESRYVLSDGAGPRSLRAGKIG